MSGRSLLSIACVFSLSVAFGQVNKARDLVNPFIGTGGHGHTFPGACVPNGLVQLSPDTRTDGVMDWDGCGGYHFSDSLIYGFSHTHLSGTGVADLCDVLLMPMSGKGSLDPTEYRSQFRHASEAANPGYYKVFLEDEKTLVELTSTAHCGVHRYTMPHDMEQNIVLDLRHRDKLVASRIERVGNEIIGERRSSSWAADQRLFFCIRIGHGEGSTAVALDTGADSTKAIIVVKQESTEPLIVKVGISAVSIEGARANLDAEVPGWDFDAVRKQAEGAWNAKLNKIEVEGGTLEQQRVFYTALYHCYVAPYIFNDVDGNYRGMDGEIHHADHNVYTVFSLWDTYRALHPLMTILEPEMTSDWIKTFLLHYQQSGRLPVWELWGNETDCMIGYHSVSVIADAYVKGIRGFDAELALEAMLASAMRDEPGLNAYRKQGYISSEDQSESVSKTLEYAYDDGCIDNFASYLGNKNLKDGKLTFKERANSWKHLYDRNTKFFRARRNGGFADSFDPYEVNFNFTEANAWQYSLSVPQDIQGLISAQGDWDGLEAHLDSLFAANSETTGREQSDITGLIGQYAHGNEPSHHMAYLYDRIGKPEKTRVLAKQIMEEMYHDAPDGLSGNEDCGQMSAWYVLSAMGFYPISPGINDRYELGYPLFEQATIKLDNGKQWHMIVGDEEAYEATVPPVHKEMLHRNRNHIKHVNILEGGSLYFSSKDRSPRPEYINLNELMSVEEGDEYPRSWRLTPIAPVISATNATFTDTLSVTVFGNGHCTVRRDTLSRTCPMNEPFVLARSYTVEVDWDSHRAPVMASFTKVDGSRTIQLASSFANQYAAGGENALIDGLRGSIDFRTGEWQGYEGKDLLATIDLGKPRTVKRIGLSVLQDQKSWIWLPAEVQFAFSINQRQWSTVTVVNDVPRTTEGSLTKELWTEPLDKQARYIKVIAKNAGPCPEWHPGKGGKTWIFADEVLMEVE